MKRFLSFISVLILVWSHICGQRLYTEKEYGGAQNGFFGKIDDEFDITPTGQLNYEIPIPVLSGSGGMKPSISVNYSSSTKDGLLGYGFDLTGLSIISRIPSDMFHDGRSTAVDFSCYDQFALDGQRLVLKATISETEREYRTENDCFAQIIATGPENAPTSFTVKTKSGLHYQYSTASKLIGGSDTIPNLFWPVVSIKDTKGNFIGFSYSGDVVNNDFRPSSISYTGNTVARMAPYASVKFKYIDNEYAPVTYVGGLSVKKSKIISQIDLVIKSRTIRSYKFDYQVVNRKYQLASVTESNGSGVSKNPTEFTWSNISDFKVTNYKYEKTNTIHNAILTTGDFNGDGLTDFISTPQDKNAGWTGWKLFVSHGTSFIPEGSGVWAFPDDELEQVVSGDFNGDGYTDIAVKRCHSEKYGKYHQTDLYLSSGEKKTFQFSRCVLSLTDDYTLYPAELNGDGAVDLFVPVKNSNLSYLIYTNPTSMGSVPFDHSETYTGPAKWDNVEIGDFNGDGISDILNMVEDGSYMIYSDCGNYLAKYTKQTIPDKYHYLNLGDFNGDGKTDMLLTGWSKDPNTGGWKDWLIKYSVGNGSFKSQYFEKPFDAKSKYLFVSDINGDGYDDFQAVDRVSNGNYATAPQAYINDGCGNFYSQFKGASMYAPDKWRYYIGDFNGDGKADFVCTSDWNNSNWDGYQLFLMPDDINGLLTGITDGMGNHTEIEYKYLSYKNVFKRGNTCSYPLTSVALTWPVVTEVTVPDGNGATKSMSYTYADALMHFSGRGMLGFGKTTVKNHADYSETITEYSVNEQEYLISPSRITVNRGGRKYEVSDYSYELKQESSIHYANRIFTFLPSTVHTQIFDYNGGAVLKETETFYEYDAFGNPTKTTIKDGEIETVTTNTYINDESKWQLGRLTESKVVKTYGGSTITKTSQFEYDNLSGLLTAEIFAPDNTNIGYRKEYVHDSFGNITESSVSPIGSSEERISRTTYDAQGRFILSTENALGFIASNEYDETTGIIASSKDINGLKTTFTSDAFGNIVSSHSDLEDTYKTTGWSAGMADAPANALYFTWQKSTGAPESIEFYDCYGRVLRNITQTIGGKKIYKDYKYTHEGYLDCESEPYFAGDQIYWTQYYYDYLGRMTIKDAPDGSTYDYEYNGLSVTAQDPLGNKSTKISNSNGFLVGSIDSNGTSIEYTYDADGNCIETKGPRTTITCTFDIAGNRISIDDPDIGYSEDSYNAFGELVSHKDYDDESTFRYDAGGRLIEETRPDVIITTTYDSQFKGLPDEVVSDGEIVTFYTYEYDKYGRLTSKTSEIDAEEFVTSYTYNTSSQVETITYPNGLCVKNVYDACGTLISVTDASSNKPYWQLLEVNARNQPVKEKAGNGLITTTVYDSKTGLTDSILTPGVQQWAYAYDTVGNLTSRSDVSRNYTETFTYDNLYRLIQATKTGNFNNPLSQTITYDNAGNITSKSDVGTYTYVDGTNKLDKISSAKRSLIDLTQIFYSSFGKVTFIKYKEKLSNKGYSLILGYGPLKERVYSNNSKNNTTKYYVDNIYERVETAGRMNHVNYILAAGKAVAMVTQSDDMADEVQYIHHDHLGSIQALTDKNGILAQEFSYDAWGMRRNPDTWEVYALSTDADAKCDYGFGGHEHIDIFDLVNMDGRIYDPIVGRFISADPIVQSPDLTQSLNRYAYCVNNPLSLIDPTGYSWFSRNWKSIFSAIVGIGVSVVTLGTGTSIGAVLIAGVAGGAAGALTNSLLNGANIGQIAKNTFTGAFWGGASGFFNFASGFGTGLEKLFKHAFSQGVMEAVQGGNMFHGFMMGAVSCIGSGYTNRSSYQPMLAKLATSAAISGCIDEIGGGKFANGAVTGAFSFLFNDYMHRRSTVDEIKETYLVYFVYDMKGVYGMASMIVKSRVMIDNYIQEKKLKMTLSLSSWTYCPEEFIGAFRTHLYLGNIDKGEIYYENVIRHSIMMPGTNYAGLKELEYNYEGKIPQVKLVITGSWNRRCGFQIEPCKVRLIWTKSPTFTHLINPL